MKKKYLVFSIIFLVAVPLFSQEKYHKWMRVAGKWEIKDSKAFETRGRGLDWNYYELLNFNTILTLKGFNNFTSIDYTVNLVKRVQSPTEIMFPFAVSEIDFYHIYAFKITGDFWNMDRVSFIFSDRLDKTKPFETKNNIFVNELASAKCKVKYDKVYNYRIAFEEKNAVLYINGDKILSAPFPENSYNGRIGISSRNVKIAVDKIEIKNGDKTVFEDDFNEDSIYVKVLKATVVPNAKEP
ncbi:MAG: hypothetical protein FWF73_06750 [Spirochaetes bacterium]|nr:hypothetical protein [Spirochaetota bacterium]